MLDKIVEENPEVDFVKADGLDDAVIGYECLSDRLIYSISKCLNVLCEDSDMTYEEALDYFYYNIEGAYVGEKTPIWCWDI